MQQDYAQSKQWNRLLSDEPSWKRFCQGNDFTMSILSPELERLTWKQLYAHFFSYKGTFFCFASSNKIVPHAAPDLLSLLEQIAQASPMPSDLYYFRGEYLNPKSFSSFESYKAAQIQELTG